LLRETVEQLAVRSGGVYVDATVGEGGHASAILLASAPRGVVLGIDRDPRSLARALQRLEPYRERFIPVAGNYADMVELARANGIARADGVLLDLGFSSRQVQEPGYGFSFQRDELLDMRFDPQRQILTAGHIVNTYSQDELSQILFRYGEEPRARSIARDIIRNRPINTTGGLATLIARTMGAGRRGRRINPATRTFQALRIAVNDELTHLAAGLLAAVQLLSPGGRLVVISYHSLEDRLVKNTLAQEAAWCICPPELPECVCRRQPTLRIVNRRIIRPGDEEVAANPRSRSAKMRVAERI
jgi:16S rRNA (cytosine1402-N4)-methyltransferase